MSTNFYATVKMSSGEEVLSEVMVTEENGDRFLLMHNPIVIEDTYSFEDGMPKVSARRWLRFSQRDTTLVNMRDVITMSELDKYGVNYYMKYLIVAKVNTPVPREMKSTEHNGYLGNIEDYRKGLEDLFDKS